MIRSIPSIAPIKKCHFLPANAHAAETSLPDLLLWSSDAAVDIVQSRVPFQELASFQQNDISNIWPLIQVDNKGKNSLRCHEFISLSVGNHSTHVLSIPDNLTKVSVLITCVAC